MDSNYSNSFLFCYPNIFCLLKKFRKGVSYPTFFAPCEIMCLTNGFMEFKKEFCLLQALATLKDSGPDDTYDIFQGILQDFLSILTTLNFVTRKILHLARHFFRELASAKYFTRTNFRKQVFSKSMFSITVLDFGGFLYSSLKFRK